MSFFLEPVRDLKEKVRMYKKNISPSDVSKEQFTIILPELESY
ncbi:hypothetical protein [Wolbachia pipientis]|nr:hypothetical protein [Wolbachia pipientis]